MNIVLFGLRGSGKTTLGRILAEQLWKTFVDTDDRVRARFPGQTIAEVWQRQGESAFRAAEVEVVRSLAGVSEHVIALGGGTLMQPQAREVIAAMEDTRRIYLYCDPAVLGQRVRADAASAGERPALTGAGDPVAEMALILAQRDPVYRAAADAVFDVTDLSPGDAVRYLIKRCL